MDIDFDAEQASQYRLYGITLFNFKSYSGLVKIGPFTDLTMVIGTNGSGKSNLMDAISFALLVSQRKLRSQQITDLINNQDSSLDTTLSPSSQAEFDNYVCYVTLHFGSKVQDDERVELTELTRAIPENYSNSRRTDTVFMVNKSRVERLTYINKLMDLGFNSSEKPFIIFQNTITNFVSADPKFFTKVIEELSGSLKFKKRYDPLKTKVSEMHQTMTTLNHRKRDLHSTKRFLTQLRSALSDYKDNQQKVGRLKSQKTLLSLYNNKMQYEDSLKRLDYNSNKIAEENGKIGELKRASDERDKEFKEIFNKWKTVNNREHLRESEQIALKDSLDKCNFEVESSRDNVKSGERDLEVSRKDLEDLEEKILVEETKQDELQLKIDNEKLKGSPEGLESPTEEDLDEYCNKKLTFFAKRVDIDEENKETISDFKDYSLNKRILEKTHDMFHNEIQFQEIGIEYMDKLVKSHKEQKVKIMNERRETLEDCDRLGQNLDVLSRCLEEELPKMIDISEENRSLKHLFTQEAHNEFVERLQQQFGVSKVPGRVSTLFQIGDKYVNALFGAMEDHYWSIVVDTEETMAKIVTLDFQPCLGSQDYLVLETIQQDKDIGRRRKDDSGEVRLSSLVKYDQTSEWMTKLADYLFGDTVVHTNLRKISESTSRHHSVALSGDFFKSDHFASYRTMPKDREQIDPTDFDRRLAQKESNFYKLKREALLLQFSPEQRHLHYKDIEYENDLRLIKESKHGLKAEINLHRGEIEKKNAEMALLKTEIKEKETAYKETVDKMAQLDRQNADFESELFAELLEKHNITSIHEFEIGKHSRATDPQEELITLQSEYNISKILLESLNDQKTAVRRKILNTERILIENRKALKDAEGKLRVEKKKWLKKDEVLEAERKKHEKLRVKYEKAKEDKEKLESEVMKLKKSLVAARNAQRSIKSSIDQLKRERHEIYEKVFIECIKLNFEHDDRQFLNIFEFNQDKTIDDFFEEEEDLKPDFKDVSRMTRQFANDHLKLQQKLTEIDEEIQQLSTEMSKCRPVDEVELNDNIHKNEREIKILNREVANIRVEQKQKNEEFDNVKNGRVQAFNAFLEHVSKSFQKVYKELTGEVSAQTFLHCENTDEPYLGGVRLSVIVPNKQFQDMSLLSCGEKTLIAFSFIYSLYTEKCPTFFVIDEIDGSVDPKNLKLLANFIKAKTEKTQFIVITHRQGMMENGFSAIGIRLETNSTTDSKSSKALALDLRPYIR